MEDYEREKLERLKASVQRHEVCWEVSPLESATTQRETLQVGYEVLVAGIFNDPERTSDITMREKADVVLEALREVTADLREHAGLPPEHRIKSYDEALQASSRRAHRSEVRIKLALLHKEGFHIPVDDKLTDSLQLVESRLKTLGASKGSWKKH